jgi:uncharacterized membrane protein YhaH (DUF805 family)
LNNPYSAPSAQIDEFDQDDETYKPKIFALEGRIGRVRYIGYSWIAMIVAMFVVGLLTAVLARPSSNAGSGAIVAQLLTSLPIFAVSIIMGRRRLHDLNQSGWWAALTIVPLANLALGLYLLFAPGTDGPNDFGPPPDKSSSNWVVIVLVLAIPVIGILAAVAIPAYHDYTVRAKAAREQQLQQQQPQQDQQAQQNQQQ